MVGAWSVSAKFTALNQESWPYPFPESTSAKENSVIDVDSTIDQLQTSEPYPAASTNQTILYSAPLNVTYSFSIFLPVVSRSYDRIAAVTHADQFAHGRSEDYPEFGTGCSCDDCTNYVSQSLNKGGVGLRTGTWDPNSPFEWWYRKVLLWYQYSKTWSATDWFNRYVSQYPDEFEVYTSPIELEAGDFFLMDLHGIEISDPPDGIPDHARFVVGMGYSSVDPAEYTCTENPIPPSTFQLLTNQHCVDRKHITWFYNIGGVSIWPIHVVDSPTMN